ncbi:MAG: pseudouridine synthase [Minisyncoccia bacterium]
MTPNNIEFPIRINTYMGRTGMCTRKAADSYINQGQVLVNNKRAVLGQMVQKGDVVTLNAKVKTFTYALWNKPRGVTTPESKIIENSGTTIKTFPIGRLDKDTDGLILLSDDTRLSERLLNPKFEHEKEYVVTTRENILPVHIKRMLAGVRIMHDGKRVFAKALRVEKKDTHTLEMVLTEGKKHQIRQMCSAVQLTISTLTRVRINTFTNKKMRHDGIRILNEKEVLELQKSVGLA